MDPAHVESIRAESRALDSELEAENRRHEAELLKIKQKRKNLEERCGHPFSDTGAFESRTCDCSVCGAGLPPF